jgi:hypothetical protein
MESKQWMKLKPIKMAILKRLKSTMTTFEMNAKINGKTKKDKG